MWISNEIRASKSVAALFLVNVCILNAACPANPDVSGAYPSEASVTSENGEISSLVSSASGGDGVADLPSPSCENLQLSGVEAVQGAGDIVAVCDDALSIIVALNRPQSIECTSAPAEITPCTDPGGECVSDGDCEALGPYGQCGSFDGLGGLCACVLPCTTDADCSEGRACLCRSGVFLTGGFAPVISHTSCWPAGCRVDADCGPEGQCAIDAQTGCGIPIVACRDSSDACQSALDCSPQETCARATRLDAWQCADEGSCQ